MKNVGATIANSLITSPVTDPLCGRTQPSARYYPSATFMPLPSLGESTRPVIMDNYLEEAMKMRNLLEEFRANHGIRPPTILGVREHVFTGSVSSLAWFMSNQETSFVTLGQRVLANPLKFTSDFLHGKPLGICWNVAHCVCNSSM
ncbi:hypothetical protein RHGRI_007756 [Rhododendron griersonianum]|uniref:Glycosyl transferase 48 domain-containing protein n=1 Tax=Rhododendron griersonianum TaxID=479676 RepID=A0AAV6KZT5_9ERIC|nr:hypothetical protein RHGRI_007756 [Rhododendron griersonianum]